MKRLIISLAAAVLGLAVTATAQAKGPGSSGGNKPSGSHSGNNFSKNSMSKDFHKGNPKFHDKDFCKNFTHRWWSSEFGCYYYWCPTSSCYYYWYEPFSCYCPIEYISVARPVVVVTQPVVIVKTVTTPVVLAK